MTEELETSLIVGTQIRLKSLFVDLQLACRLLVSETWNSDPTQDITSANNVIN